MAFIISKYVDVKEISPDAVVFISDVVNKLTPEEYLRCVMLLTEQDEETIKKERRNKTITKTINPVTP